MFTCLKYSGQVDRIKTVSRVNPMFIATGNYQHSLTRQYLLPLFNYVVEMHIATNSGLNIMCWICFSMSPVSWREGGTQSVSSASNLMVSEIPLPLFCRTDSLVGRLDFSVINMWFAISLLINTQAQPAYPHSVRFHDAWRANTHRVRTARHTVYSRKSSGCRWRCAYFDLVSGRKLRYSDWMDG